MQFIAPTNFNRYSIFNDGGGGGIYPVFDLPLMTSAIASVAGSGGGTPTMTRATAKTVTNHEGQVVTLLSGEIGYLGNRRVRNFLTFTEDFSNAAWGTISGGTGSVPTKTNNYGSVAAPDGTFTACRLQWDCGGAPTLVNYSLLNQTMVVTAIARGSIYARATSGTATLGFRGQGGTTLSSIALTTTWVRVADAVGVSATTNYMSLGGYNGAGGNTGDVLLWHPLMEDVTGQSNQNPSEYVSVGVVATPFFGCGVDGVKCFAYENGNTVASNVVTEATGPSFRKWGSLPGVSGSYFSTPDSVAASITGDIDIRVKVAMTDWILHIRHKLGA